MATAAMELTIEPRVNARGKAVKYAEELGLNTSFQEAAAAAEALGILYHQRDQHEVAVRAIKAMIVKREHRLAEQVREANPDAGPTAHERSTKMVHGADDELVALAADLRDELQTLGGIEAEIKSNEVIARLHTARMNQLGGYFSYLAASKEALTAERILGQIP